jgi:hypothetical protein
MEALIAVLALVGIVALVRAGIDRYQQQITEPSAPPEADLAAPYREGLYAAIRMQAVAQDLERQLYVEAARHAEAASDGER